MLDQFIKERYEYLRECAINICKKKDTNLAEDLLSELILFLYTKPDKIKKYMNGQKDLEAFSVKWMNSQITWYNSPFNNKFKKPITHEDINEGYEMNITDDDVIKDLSSIYTTEQINKIMTAYDLYDTFTPAEQLLFRLYFIEGLSLDAIKNSVAIKKMGRKYIGRSIIFYEIKKIRDKIKDKYDRDINSGKY